MKIYLCNYSDLSYRKRQEDMTIRNNSTKTFDEVFSYTREWLETTDFYKENRHILDQPRGNGYWLWKPYIILDAMSKMEYGDAIFYIDCGDVFGKNFNKVIQKEFQNRDYLVRFSSNKQEKYTKADCFVYMDCFNFTYLNAPQVEAGVIGFKKTDTNINFINEWLSYAKDERILTDIPNQSEAKNADSFIDHRHDQSILNNLLVKYNFLYHSDNLNSFTSCNIEEKDLQPLLSVLDRLDNPL